MQLSNAQRGNVALPLQQWSHEGVTMLRQTYLARLICSMHSFKFTVTPSTPGGRNSSVCIATRYGLDGPGIESRCGRDFPHPSRPALGAHPASCTMGTGSFPGVKRPGRAADPPPPIFSAEVSNWVKLLRDWWGLARPHQSLNNDQTNAILNQFNKYLSQVR